MAQNRTVSFSILALLIALLISFRGFADEVKVVLTGNTSDLEQPKQLLEIIDQYCSIETSPTLWVLNGDIFPAGFTKKEIITWNQQITEILNKFSNLQILINQGDRDWANSGKSGWEKVKELEKEIKKNKHDRLHLYINKGCPGPWNLEFSPFLDIAVINSQWWNQPYEKPIASLDVCDVPDEGVFLEELRDYLDEIDNKNVLILSHFPLESLGKYGGRFPVSSYLWPPIIGSAVTSFHQNIGNQKDIVNEKFDEIRNQLNSILLDHSSMVFASAHEKNHSIISSGENYYINSGALVEGDFALKNNKNKFASSEGGFMELTYHDNAEVSYQFIGLNYGKITRKAKGVLLQSACEEDAQGFKNTAYLPCLEPVAHSETLAGQYFGKEKVRAGASYQAGKFKELWLGKHYRASWTAEVEVPYLNLDTTFQGLEIRKKGGGRQTTSLQMLGANEKEYVFRSVDKDPSKALDYELRGTLVSDVFQDQTTTQQPYGAMPVAYLLNRLDILHANPTLYVLPPGEDLGSWNTYGNLFGMLEDRPSDKIEKGKIFGSADHIEKSYKLFQKLYDDHDNRIVKSEFARARIFDLWVGDWSKHEDNWKWAGYKEKGGELFRPIPRDRDHAFSRWDGILPWLADREWAKPSGENFDYTIKGLPSLMWQARHLDRLVGNEISRDDWVQAAKEIQSSINDEDIEAAIRTMPAEVYAPDGKEIENKLKARIKDLPIYAAEFYNILSKEVDVVGSNKAEYFHVLRNQDGSVEITVYDLDKKNKQPIFDKVYYRRTFYLNETKEVRLYGLNQDDVFLVEGKAEKSILIRIVSGYGEDFITDKSVVRKGGARTLIYEKDDDGEINLGKEAKRIQPKDESLYYYDRTRFTYNSYLPLALISYNTFTGIGLQGGVTFTQQNFSKPDFSVQHKLRGGITSEGNYEIGYSNQLRYLIGKWDGTAQVNLSRPLNYNYFFGIGNNTANYTERGNDYYRAQYNSFLVSLGLTRTFWKKSAITLTANYELDNGIIKDNSYLAEDTDVFGNEEVNLFYLKGNLNLDFRDAFALPERGFHFEVSQFAGHIPESQSSLSSVTTMAIEQFFSTYNRNPVTLGIRLGGGISDGQLPYYKLLSLGQLNDLHGYKRNRFTGESKAFLNTELRWQLTETRNTLIPVKVGVRGFFDVGRVWATSDPSSANKWHDGYGAGFYIAPFREQFNFNLSVGFSEEDTLLMFGIGSFFR